VNVARNVALDARCADRRRLAHMIPVHHHAPVDRGPSARRSALITGPELRWMRSGPIDGRRGLRIAAAPVRTVLDDALLDRLGGGSRSPAASVECAASPPSPTAGAYTLSRRSTPSFSGPDFSPPNAAWP
jgi:hypothetical protein